MISPLNDAAIHFIVTSRRCQEPARKLNTGTADQRYHRFMSETPPTGHPSAPGPVGFPPGLPPPGPWGPPGPIALNTPARWPMLVMFLITLVAVAAAVAAWLRPIPHNSSVTPPAPTFSDQQVADAKSKVCAAYWKVQNVVTVNVARTAGDDPNSRLLIAVNQRQVFVIGSAYLMTTLAEQPATPADISAAANDLAHLYQVMTLDGLVGNSNDPAHNAADQAGFKIQGLCK
jgi:hypothetical protein